MKTVLTSIAVAATIAFGGAAHAEPGDTITYLFISDVSENGASSWFDGRNDQQSYSATRLHDYGRYKSHQYGSLWSGKQSVTSSSTYQLAASSFQTDGYYVECRILVNGVTKAVEVATGRYAVAVCAA